jgi:hypothetical protein
MLGDYACFQIENGAQVIQLFDSWAGNLSPLDYDTFAAPYQRMVIEKIKKNHPTVPTIIYINKSGALLERMAATGIDIISLDWTVKIEEARLRIGDKIGIHMYIYLIHAMHIYMQICIYVHIKIHICLRTYLYRHSRKHGSHGPLRTSRRYQKPG